MDDATYMRVGTNATALPHMEVRGSEQFIKYLRHNLNTTWYGYPVLITIKGCDLEVCVKDVALFTLVTDASIIAGYCTKLL